MRQQLSHQETTNCVKTFPLVVLCENFLSPENVGMTFRICEAMGVHHLYLAGSSPTLPNRKIVKAARSAHKRIPHSHQLATAGLLHQLNQDGYTLIGLEITNQSKDIRTFDFTTLDKIAFIAVLGLVKDLRHFFPCMQLWFVLFCLAIFTAG